MWLQISPSKTALLNRQAVLCFVVVFSVWFGVIFIRHGLYQDGVFKFTVYIPDNYPDGECPVSSTPPRSHRGLGAGSGRGLSSRSTESGFNPQSP